MDGPQSTPLTRRFEVALQARQLEISLFWQRSLFFWGFISAGFIAISALKEQLPTLSLLVSGFGLVCSVSWALVSRGSKYWQEQWESKIEEIEKAPEVVNGPLFQDARARATQGLVEWEKVFR
jgi:hypothetical protein